jgi:hypothetical protein
MAVGHCSMALNLEVVGGLVSQTDWKASVISHTENLIPLQLTVCHSPLFPTCTHFSSGCEDAHGEVSKISSSFEE